MSKQDEEWKNVVKDSTDKLENLLKVLPEMATILLHFAVIVVKYETGEYDRNRFLNEFTVISDMILESKGEIDESKGSNLGS